jgi:hypothetical protein
MNLNPQSEERLDRRFALLLQGIWNVQIAKAAGRSGNPPKYRELHKVLEMFRMGDQPEYMAPPPTRNQSSAEMWASIRAMVKSMARKKTPAGEKEKSKAPPIHHRRPASRRRKS